jgi:phosphatidate cytidylyltransferase
MSNLVTRGITGFFFVAIIVSAIVVGEKYMVSLFGIVALLCLNEFYDIFSISKYSPNKYLGIFLGIVFYSLYIYSAPIQIYTLLFVLTLPIIALTELFRNKPNPFQNIGLTITGILYIVIPFILINSEHFKKGSFWLLLSIFILTWTSDTFAFLVGRKIGKHKLFERLSPKKSWEGFIGGFMFSILAGYVIAHFTGNNITKFMLYGAIISIFGTLGDLVESMLKRSLNIKDTGTILPGHGGLLDRFDAVIFVIPIIYTIEVIFYS